jgi:hypothetical protein
MPRVLVQRLSVPNSATDVNGHVNNLASLQWMQDSAIEHSGARGWPLEHVRPRQAGGGTGAPARAPSLGTTAAERLGRSGEESDPADCSCDDCRILPWKPPDSFQVEFGLAHRSPLGRIVRDGGFEDVRLQEVSLAGMSETAGHAAYGLLHGNPMSAALHERGVSDASPIREALTAALAAAGGSAPFRLMRALVVEGRAV